ncbi:transposable element Tcb2 transposase [Trichonephila clavipes]|nr:transposable element Tcb2 transposase [Trichonephila clavipes]
MMEAGWSPSRVVRQLGRSDYIVRRCWDQWIREMSFTRGPGSGFPRWTSLRKDHHNVNNARIKPTASSAALQAQVVPSLGTPVSARTIRKHLAEGRLGSRRPLRVQPLMPSRRRLCLDWYRARGTRTAAEWNQVVFSNGSRFNHSSDDNRVRMWRSRGERLHPALALKRHTTPTTGGMVWGSIACNTWSPLVLIRGTMTA